MARRYRGFTDLYRQHRDWVFALCRRLCGDPVEAEDLAQDVFLLACRGFEGFQERGSAESWLAQIAVHRWQRVRERRPLTVHLEGLHRSAPTSPGTDIDRLALELALAALPVSHREVVVLTQIAGFSYAETAEVLDVSVRVVRRRMGEAFLRLRSVLQSDEPGGAGSPGHAGARESRS
jgi:RNA polymerase sigma-70 factor (ECF subfamily)